MAPAPTAPGSPPTQQQVEDVPTIAGVSHQELPTDERDHKYSLTADQSSIFAPSSSR
jgi:hypothetical protein